MNRGTRLTVPDASCDRKGFPGVTPRVITAPRFRRAGKMLNMPESPGTPPHQSPVYAPQTQGNYPGSAPGYSQQGYPAPSGAKFWGLLFLFYIPWVGVIVTIIVALVQRSNARTSQFPLVRENARWAANWALSYVIYLVVLFAALILTGVLSTAPSQDGYGPAEPSGWIALPGMLIFVIGIYCLVTMIRGCVIAGKTVHRPALAIPFFRG